MVSAKSLIAGLYRHFKVIEALCDIAHNDPFFSESELMALIAKITDADSVEACGDVLRSLNNAEIIEYFEPGNAYQLNTAVYDFISAITHEHALGLSSVLKAKIEGISVATEQMQSGLDDSDMDLLLRGAKALSSLFDQIKSQLEQDQHAIMDLADRAKTASADMPIARRYREVLDAYAQYIEPMNEMMDSGPQGVFSPRLERAERVLDAALERLSMQGELYARRTSVRAIAYKAKELRRQGLRVAQRCSEILFPLREELRQHNALGEAITTLLACVRKRGLGSLYADDKASPLLWQRDRRRRITHGLEIRDIMADAMRYQPESVAFPDAPEGGLDAFHWINPHQLSKAMKAALPIENLIEWMRQQYPDVPDQAILTHFHLVMSAEQPFYATELLEFEHSTDLNVVRVIYHPHRLTALEANEP